MFNFSSAPRAPLFLPSPIDLRNGSTTFPLAHSPGLSAAGTAGLSRGVYSELALRGPELSPRVPHDRGGGRARRNADPRRSSPMPLHQSRFELAPKGTFHAPDIGPLSVEERRNDVPFAP
jgi:hypothetical protein